MAGCSTAPCGSLGLHDVFSCVPPAQLAPDCPSVVPNRGSPCNLSSGTVCYEDCSVAVVCDGGIWCWNSRSCVPGTGGVCAAPSTPIATPTGERAIADIKVGDIVYSIDGNSVRPVPVVRVRRQIVRNHRVVRITTTDGQTLEISAPHPTADGRRFGDLLANGTLDGHTLESVEVVPYGYPFTYDILPGSDTGFYFAGGMLIGSTLPSRDCEQ